MVENQVNKAAAGDPKAFATVAHFADKFEVFKRQTRDHSALADSALENLHRRLTQLGKQPSEAQESTPQKESQSTLAQPDPKMK